MSLSNNLKTAEILDLIFKNPEAKYGLIEFEDLKKKPHEILHISPKTIESGKAKGEVRYFLKCLKRQQDIQVYSEKKSNPEEIIRQLYLYKLVNHYGYPLTRIDVEKPVTFGSGVHEKPADIVVYHKDGKTAYIVVEVKKPERRDGIDQLKSYLNAEGSPIGVWLNGKEKVLLYRPYPQQFEDTLPDLPRVDQSIDELISDVLTLDDKRVRREFDFKSIILQLEELVLANSGEDEFQEIFKIIFAKLYDEAEARERKNRELQFRWFPKEPQKTYQRIEFLFEKAVERWPGIFDEYDKIKLTPQHLNVCIGPLERIKLLGATMRIMDDAFEYLMTKVSKGAKGQYFTPRYVIDMCVKILNPKKREYVIDPACGSGGFLIHTMDWVWKKHYKHGAHEHFIYDYAAKYLFGLDFDHRAAKIARALMLIAGDGRSHVFKINSLDPREWLNGSTDGMHAQWELSQLAVKKPAGIINPDQAWEYYRDFKFDILLTNPPFAGEIHDKSLLQNYELPFEAYRDSKESKKRRPEDFKKVERHILFIERCLQFLKPGGRMAIVLPQGVFNNLTMGHIRKWLMNNARILAVVGLHENTFKPHAGVKTSVLFLQKWSQNIKPIENYPVFMATSEKSGKDNSGEYVYKLDEHGNPIVDTHGNRLIDHDLDEIADKFIDFAKEQGFEFWEE